MLLMRIQIALITAGARGVSEREVVYAPFEEANLTAAF